MDQKKYTTPSAENLCTLETKVFTLLSKVALKKLRCPTNEELNIRGFPSRHVPALAKKGFIKIILYTQNRRQVEILTGFARGCRTKKPPGTRKIIKIIEQSEVESTPFKEPWRPTIPQCCCTD
jgi:hypothetical protein